MGNQLRVVCHSIECISRMINACMLIGANLIKDLYLKFNFVNSTFSFIANSDVHVGTFALPSVNPITGEGLC